MVLRAGYLNIMQFRSSCFFFHLDWWKTFLPPKSTFFFPLSLQNNQADLENATEVLSGYLERDISQDSLQDIKQKVQDKYRFVPEQLSQSCPTYCIVIPCGMLWCVNSPSWLFLQSCPWEAAWCQPPAMLWDPQPAPEPPAKAAAMPCASPWHLVTKRNGSSCTAQKEHWGVARAETDLHRQV